MTKRIAYLDLKGGAQRKGARIPEHVIAPGFAVDVVDTEIRVTPVDATDLLLSDMAYTEAAVRAERDGYSGVLIGGVPDYGLAAARAAVDIPVIGSGQASLLVAAALGSRFSIVTIWPETMSFVYDRLLRENPVGRQCISVRYVSTPAEQSTLADEDNFLTQMRSGREHMIERILAEIEGAVQDGATSVILGCNCMSPVADVLASRASVPIVDPTTAGYRQLESMVALGLQPARDPRVPKSDRHHVLTEMVKAADLALGANEEDCPVCVLNADGTASCDLPVSAPAAFDRG
ncbi:putative Hydantoin racemase [Rhodococcus sp. RD6.2]|uniref:aspartate/glutamate racemase family protein n=1 Tax=Rhodococcus sp. RD6.2 TaxID=260936 RepID=UPI00063B8687|nr:aspartate/glutamate racemase family protein [Rhodococcus sp. RD6.2]CRK49727.1 putative Hydantoin racemase [Rhodococcus sp. RD6.2]